MKIEDNNTENIIAESLDFDKFYLDFSYYSCWPKISINMIKEIIISVCESIPQNIKRKFYISILLANNHEVHKYNLSYRGKDYPTNILSFEGSTDISDLFKDNVINSDDHSWYHDIVVEKNNNLEEIFFTNNENTLYLGDIIISYEKVKEESDKIGFSMHFLDLIIHGILHLLKYHHNTDEEEEIMNNIASVAKEKFLSNTTFANFFQIHDKIIV